MKLKIYVGLKAGQPREVFRCENIPIECVLGQIFHAVIGPFDILRAARFCADHGQANPHVQCVADAERIAKQLALSKLTSDRAAAAAAESIINHLSRQTTR